MYVCKNNKKFMLSIYFKNITIISCEMTIAYCLNFNIGC